MRTKTKQFMHYSLILSFSLLFFIACNDDENVIIPPSDITVESKLGANGADVILTWSESTSKVTELLYSIAITDSIIAEVNELTYTVTGLDYNREYTFSIFATDNSGIKSDTSEVSIKTAPYGNGVFISNEGNFGKSNGSVSFYYYGTDLVVNNIFQTVNNRVLGDVVQSIKTSGDKAYIVVNNSNKVEVVNRYTFKELGAVEGITSPRRMEVNGTTGYVTCWDNTVKAIDLNTLKVIKSIPVGTGAEGMLIVGEKLYVANGGAYGKDSTISVVDMNTNEVVSSIELKYNPISMVLDKDGFLWALCAGKTIYGANYALVEESPSMLYKVDLSSNTPVFSFELFTNDHPKMLQIDNDGSTLYVQGGYISTGLYNFTTDGSQGTLTKIIDAGSYGFSYDKEKDELYLTDAGDYASAGKLVRYSTSGSKLGEYTVGLIPNGASFKNAK